MNFSRTYLPPSQRKPFFQGQVNSTIPPAWLLLWCSQFDPCLVRSVEIISALSTRHCPRRESSDSVQLLSTRSRSPGTCPSCVKSPSITPVSSTSSLMATFRAMVPVSTFILTFNSTCSPAPPKFWGNLPSQHPSPRLQGQFWPPEWNRRSVRSHSLPLYSSVHWGLEDHPQNDCQE